MSNKELFYRWIYTSSSHSRKKVYEESNILNRYTGSLVHDHETVIYNYGDKHIECNVH